MMSSSTRILTKAEKARGEKKHSFGSQTAGKKKFLLLGCNLNVNSISSPHSLQNVDFLWDNAECLPHGFSIEPCKGTFEPGRKETITITWTPTSNYMVKMR